MFETLVLLYISEVFLDLIVLHQFDTVQIEYNSL